MKCRPRKTLLQPRTRGGVGVLVQNVGGGLCVRGTGAMRGPGAPFQCEGTTLTVANLGGDPARYGFIKGIGGEMNPTHTNEGYETTEFYVDAADNIFMEFDDTGSGGVQHGDVITVDFESTNYGDMPLTWNGATGKYEGNEVGIGADFAERIDTDVCLIVAGIFSPEVTWHAATYDPDTYEMQLQAVGEGVPTSTHTADIYAADHEGVYREFGADEPVWEGGRVAYDELTTKIPVALLRCTLTDEGDGVYEMIATDTNARIRYGESIGGNLDTEYVCRVDIKRISGSSAVSLSVNDAPQGGVPVSVSGEWQTFSVTGINPTKVHRFIDIYLATTNDVIQLRRPMLEVIHGANRNPSEYLDAVGVRKTFANANGNTVTDNVVTEAVGLPLLEAPWLVYSPAATNAQIQSNDLTDVEWTATNATVSKDEVGIDGVANSACRVTATSNTATVIGNVIAAASDTHAGCFYIKRAVGAAACDITVDGGVTWEPMTLSTEFEKFTIEKLDASQLGIRLGFSGDSIVVGNVEFHVGKTIAEVRGISPIFSTTSAVSTDETVYVFDTANHDDA